jgi:hypothetical protein
VRPVRAISDVGTKNIDDCCPAETLRPSRGEAVTNLEAAYALGVQISHNLLSLADDVIE